MKNSEEISFIVKNNNASKISLPAFNAKLAISRKVAYIIAISWYDFQLSAHVTRTALSRVINLSEIIDKDLRVRDIRDFIFNCTIVTVSVTTRRDSLRQSWFTYVDSRKALEYAIAAHKYSHRYELRAYSWRAKKFMEISKFKYPTKIAVAARLALKYPREIRWTADAHKKKSIYVAEFKSREICA